MKTYKITHNNRTVKSMLTKEDASAMFFPTVEDFSNGYIYDNEAEKIYRETDGAIVATAGDDYVRAGDDIFEIVEEENGDH